MTDRRDNVIAEMRVRLAAKDEVIRQLRSKPLVKERERLMRRITELEHLIGIVNAQGTPWHQVDKYLKKIWGVEDLNTN